MPIQLLLKSPSQQIDDVKVECDVQWTVENLKDYLCNAYPTKPPRNQQKIIYGGRLLPDHLLLKDIVTRDQDVHIMHIVCPQMTNFVKSNPETPKVKENENVNPTIGPSPLPNVFANAINADGLRQRVLDPQQYMSNLNSFYSQAQLPQVNAIPVTSMYNAYQMASLQQTYAQFMAQFFAQGQQGFAIPNPTVNATPNVNTTVPTNVPNPQVNFNPPAANPRRMNENEEAERFDIIDSMYFITRITMLLIVLYFYSTPGRIILVLGIGILLCMYHFTGRRQSNQQPRAPVNQNTRPQSDIAANNEAEPRTNTSDSQDANNSENESSTSEQPIVQPTVHHPSKLETLLVFVKTLFTSLIPDQPLPVDVN